jgi:UrcA family protein
MRSARSSCGSGELRFVGRGNARDELVVTGDQHAVRSLRLHRRLESHSARRNELRSSIETNTANTANTEQTTETVMNSINTRFTHPRRAFGALGALAACLIGAAGGALAASPADGAATVKVAFSDLNLASDQGNSTLYARISAAAREVCQVDRADIRDLARYAQARSCEAQAIAKAVQAVHSPRLAAIYSAHLPRG